MVSIPRFTAALSMGNMAVRLVSVRLSYSSDLLVLTHFESLPSLYPYMKLWATIFFRPARLCASSYPYIYHHHHPPSTLSSHCGRLLFSWTYPSSIFDMSQPPSSSSFQALFDAALKDYENRTGISIVNHPIAKKLEECDSLDSITAILREQAKGLHDFRGDKGKLMKSVMCSVDVLYTFSTVLGERIGIVRRNIIGIPCS